jgi:outer membrane receptor protein involved in Fe transport
VPETTTHTQVVYEQHLGGRVRLSGSVFHTHIDQLISEAGGQDDIFFVNSPRIEATGAAGELEMRWPNGVVARGSYSHQLVEEAHAETRLSNAPRHLAVANLMFPFAGRRGTIGASLTHVGSRLTTLRRLLEPATLTNLTARFRPVGSRLSLVASVYNLFDVRHAHPVGAEFRQDSLIQAGRSASARVVFGF